MYPKGSIYADQNHTFIYIAPGPAGNLTFYKTDDPRKRKGRRIKVRKIPQWYRTEDEAQTALEVYANKKGWRLIHERT